MIFGRLILFLLAAFAVTQAEARTEPFDPFGAAGIDFRPGAAAPMDIVVQDEAGRSVTLRQLADGKPLILAPVQHHCPNICGLTLEGLRDAMAGQDYRPGRDFAVIAFGIDPREDAAAASESVQRFGGGLGKAGVHAVTGSPAAVASVAAALGYRFGWDPRINQYAHMAAVAVLTPDGKLSRWLYGVAPTADDLHLALTEAGRGRLGGLGEQIRLLCYHYDPQTGRYSSLVMAIVRWTGVMTAGALSLAIALMVRRDRGRAS